jgi:hypothetical protein
MLQEIFQHLIKFEVFPSSRYVPLKATNFMKLGTQVKPAFFVLDLRDPQRDGVRTISFGEFDRREPLPEAAKCERLICYN